MGFLDRFKTLLAKEQEIQQIEISSDGLSQWVDDETGEQISELKVNIRETIEKINNEREILREKIEVLETEKLKNDNIPIKEQQIMEGNRKSYINLVDIFVSKLNPPEEITYSNLSDFCSSFEGHMSDFSKSSAKSYYILQEFFKDKVNDIAGHIRKMDSLIRDLLNKEYKEVVGIKTTIAEYNKLLALKAQTEKKLEEEAENYKQIKMAIDKNELHSDRLRNSSEYLDLSKIKKEKEAKLTELKRQKDILVQIFSPLDSAMKKFSKIALDGQKEIKSYLESPINAVVEDSELKIMGILQRIEKAVENNEIELKDGKREKTLEKLKDVKKEQLTDFVDKYTMLNDSLSEMDKRTRLNSASIRLEELKYRNVHLKEKLEKSSLDIDKIKKNVENLKVDETRKSIEKQVKGSLNIELTIQQDGQKE